jgi:putative redox protein
MKKLIFKGAQGHDLSARLDTQPNISGTAPRAYALFAHCFTCSKDIIAASQIAKALVDHNIAVLRFDFTGLGASDGEFKNTNFSSNVQDLVAAADFMRREYEAPKILIGHSLGGAAVLAAACDIKEAKAVATINAPSDAAHVAHHFQNSRADILKNGKAEILLAGRPFTIQKQFIDDIEAQTMDAHISQLNRALLVCHAPLDKTVGIENASHIFKTAQHPKSFLSLDDADHLLSNKRHARYAADVIAAWASRYITPQDEADEPSATAIDTPTETTIVRSIGDTLRHNVNIGGRHHLVADEPASMGGDEKGPAPYEFLCTALAACKAMTMRIYAKHKGFALKDVEVWVTHDKIDFEGQKRDRFQCEINIEGDDLSAEQRDKIIEIAKKCPVHRTLQSESIIETKPH